MCTYACVSVHMCAFACVYMCEYLHVCVVWAFFTFACLSVLQFEESMIVYDACRLIRERVPDAAQGQRKYSFQFLQAFHDAFFIPMSIVVTFML